MQAAVASTVLGGSYQEPPGLAPPCLRSRPHSAGVRAGSTSGKEGFERTQSVMSRGSGDRWLLVVWCLDPIAEGQECIAQHGDPAD